MNYRSKLAATQITYEYYCVLQSHSWSRGKAFRTMHSNGNHIYFTYHLWS